MSDPFVHLHVASGYSLQYGASHPHVLVERAAEQEMDALALTDRDGTYGAVRFVKAATAAGIRPILGVDLAMGGDPRSSRERPADHRRAGTPRPADPGPPCGAAPPGTPGCPGSPSWPADAAAGRRCAGWSRPPMPPASGGRRCARPTWWPSTSPARLTQATYVSCWVRPPSWVGQPPCAATTSGRRCCSAGWTSSDPSTSSWRWSPTAFPVRVRAAPRTPPGWPAWLAVGSGAAWASACRWSSPTRSASPTGSMPPPPTCSTPPAGSCRWTCATSTAATPRGS